MEENGLENKTVSKVPWLLIKFDKYNEWQTYQWMESIALRIWSDNSVLNELTSYKLFKELW